VPPAPVPARPPTAGARSDAGPGVGTPSAASSGTPSGVGTGSPPSAADQTGIAVAIQPATDPLALSSPDQPASPVPAPATADSAKAAARVTRKAPEPKPFQPFDRSILPQ
jgi:hypothetical protein